MDASIALSWCFEDESGPAQMEVLDRLSAGLRALVPSIWALEIVNGGLIGERRGRVVPEVFRRFLLELLALPIDVEAADISHALGEINRVSRTYSLTSYDAAYLELAIRYRLPLVTIDVRLAAAARKAGVSTSLPR